MKIQCCKIPELIFLFRKLFSRLRTYLRFHKTMFVPKTIQNVILSICYFLNSVLFQELGNTLAATIILPMY